MRLMIAWTCGLSACVSPATDTTTGDSSPIDFTGADLVATTVGPNSLQLAVDLEEPGTPTVTCQLDVAPPVVRQLVPFGGEWSWLPSEDLPNLSWIEPSFDDQAWNRARLSIGYEEAVRTTIPAQTSNLWLRTTFTIAEGATVENVTARYRRDDGVAMWINGVDVLRDNAPKGLIEPDTRATESASGAEAEKEMHTAELRADVLKPGENVLAVALLEASSFFDMSFEARVSALVQEPADPSERHVVHASSSGASHEIAVRGLLADATYTCTVSSDTGEPLARETFETPALSPPPPALALEPGSTLSPGYVMFNHQRPCAKDYVNWLIIADNQGRVRWRYDTGIRGRSSLDIEAHLLDPERILFAGGDQLKGRPKIVNLDQEVEHEAAYPGVDDVLYHHDLVMDGENILGLHTTEIKGAERVAEGFGFTAYNPDTQKVVWQWDAQSALDAGKIPDPGTEANPYHANAFSLVTDEDGPAIYVSLFKQEWIIRIDRNTGDVDWKMGVGGDFTLLDSTGTPLDEIDWFDRTHGISAYSPNRLWVYDNGRVLGQSEAIALTLDPAKRTATVDWRWTEFGWNEPLWGELEELPNGNASITMAHAECFGANPEHMGSLVELDPVAKDVVWRLDFLDADDATYRSQRLDGCAVFANEAMCPAVAGR